MPVEVRTLTFTDYCSAYPAYNSVTLYEAGAVVAYSGHVWTARVQSVGQTPGGGFGGYWIDGGVCPPPPDPDPTGQPPSVTQLFPTDQLLVDSRTPLLTAEGHSNDDDYPVQFTFKICDNENMTGSGCQSSGELAEDVMVWRVPASHKLAWSKQYWWTVKVKDAHSGATTTSGKWTFTTGVRQPAITSQLAARGVNGQEFQQLAGNYTTTATDASVTSAGPPLSIVRSYNSLDPRRDGLFGAGWSTRFDMKVLPETGGVVDTLLVTYPDGQQVRFAANGDGTFQPPPGMYATLGEVSGGGWRLMDKSSTIYLFDAQGRLTKISDAHNRALELERATDGKLTKVSAPGGRYLTFAWTGGHVTSVSTPPVDGAALTWTYTYVGDQLTGVCAPVAAPNCTAIEYGTGSLYRSSVLNSGPLGYWRLNETTGTEAADSGNGAGVAHYSDATLGQPGALSGTADKAASFNGEASLSLPTDDLNRLRGTASFETWFKTGGSGIVMQLGSFLDGWTYREQGMLYVGTDGKLRGQLRTRQGATPIAPITSAAAVNNNAWHHVVLTLTETEQRMYLDGQQVGVLTGAPSTDRVDSATVAAGEIIGTWPAVPTSKALPYTGQIDEVALYDHPLTLQEAQAHYAARTSAPYELTKLTQPSGRVWAVNTYDAATDRLKTHTDQNGGLWKIGTRVYDANTGLATFTVTDPKNESLKYVHDAWRGYRLVSRTDQLLKVTSYRYDTGGFLTKTTDPNNNTVEQVNDARGNVTAVKTCRAAGNCQTAYHSYYRNSADEFDPRNDQVTATRDARSSGATDNTYATVSEYTAHGELAKQTTPATSDFPTGRSDIFTYTDGTESAVGGGTTPAGLPKSSKNAKNEETTYRYTAAGDLAEQTSPSGLVIEFTHDAVGQVISRKEISQAHPAGVITTFTYDGVGRLLARTGAGVKNEVTDVTHTAKVTFTYDADGNRLTESLADLTGGDPVRTITYAYDTHGRVETVTDPENGVTRSAWDETGAQVSATDPMGTVTTFGYSKRGEPITTTLKNWTGSPLNPSPAQDVVLESNAYDPGGRLDSRVDAMGRKTSYTYFTDNRLSQVIADDVRLNGFTTPTDVVLTDNTYDAAGNLTRQIAGGGKTTIDYAYDAASRKTSSTLDPATLKRKTAYVYDAADNVTRETFTGAGTTRTETTDYVHNALGEVTRQTVENGTDDLVSTWTYDDRGLLTSATDPRGNASGATAADFTITMRYDMAGQLVESKSPQVKIEKSGTAAVDGRPTMRYGYNSEGLRTQSVDAEGRVITSAFDKAGRLVSSSSPSYSPPGGTAVIPEISYGYDAAGRLTTATDERGYATTTQYDALGNPVRVTDPGASGPAGVWVSEFDLLGETLATVDPTGARSEATYDDLGRKITQTQIERKPTTAVLTTTMTYDAASRLTKRVVPGNKTTSFKVNAVGEVTEITDPLLHSATADYDILGRATKATDPLGNASEAEYDLAGRKTAIKSRDSAGATVRTVNFGYDAVGNPTSTTSGEGHVIHREFDALSRLTSLIEPVTASKSITTTFGYDATGARTRLTDGRGNVTWTTYNTLGLAETIVEPATTAHPAVADRTWTTVYDVAGNPVANLQPGGVRIDRTFNPLGQMLKQTGTGASVATPERTYTYDLAGRTTAIGDYTLEYNDRSLLTKLSKATAPVATYAYDNRGNPTQRVDPTGTATFTWDDASQLKTASDPVAGRTWTYDYDHAGRLTSQTSSGTANSQTYTYDAVNRPTSHTLKNGSGTELAKIVYGWDKDDNLTTKTTTGTAGAGTNAYGYDRSGRLTSWTAPGGATTDYEWDDAGNRTKAGSKTFAYDERNRLLSGDGVDYTYTPRGTVATETKNGVTKNLAFDAFDRLISDGDATYGYDALDRLTSRTKGTDQRRYVYSGLENDIAVITDGVGAVQAKYGRDPFGGLLGLQENGTTALGVMSDLHGDVVGTFSGTALVDSTAYDPFGQITHQTGTQRSLGYQGEYTDPDTGKVNMHARWYQPGTGNFASRDDWTLKPDPSIQANRYGYANGSPLVYTDPSGHNPFCDWPWHPACPMDSTADDDVAKGPCKSNMDPRPQCDGNELKGSTGSAPTGKNGAKGTGNGETTNKNGAKGTVGTAPTGKKNPCHNCGNSGPKNPGPKKPGPKKPGPEKPGPYRPDVDPNSKTFKDDPNNATRDRGPGADRTARDWNDILCTYGPCTGSHTGHRGIDIIDDGGGEWDRFCAVCLVGVIVPVITEIGSVPVGVVSVIAGPVGVILDLPTPPEPPLNSPDPPTSSKCPPAGNSFVPGTRVLMADGTRKPIEEVRVGDQVIAADPESGQVAAKPVTHLIVGDGEKHLIRVVVGPIDGSTGKIGDVAATDGHPFWVVNLHRWVTASELLPGMVLRTGAGTYVQITALKKWTAHQRVYNLTVDGIHTYHVAAGGQTVLVHNANPCEEGWTPDENYSPKEIADRRAEAEKFYKVPQDIHDIVKKILDDPNYRQRVTGPANNRQPDFYRGGNSRAGRRWTDSKIYDNGNSQSQARVLVDREGNIAYIGRTKDGVHNYDQVIPYPWAKVR
ncbi:RHS repeat-associated core domain-containing protein [Streptosporangium carneum]|uniref:RHS repeat-associated core domain-containing protein n=1 Tax=Streptosporangium carneum TaxID=47481 RepID=UPI0022F2CE22|nr:RHS repeat-associated core domain-containing protein [Streptosporangium carneum]